MTLDSRAPAKWERPRKERNIRLLRARDATSDGLDWWELRLYDRRNRKYVCRTVHGGIREARKAKTELETQIANGTYRSSRQSGGDADDPVCVGKPGPIITVADLLTRWLVDVHKPGVAGTTYHRHQQIVRNDLIPNLGHLRLGEITALDVQAYFTKARRSGLKNGKGGLSEQTLKQVHQQLKQGLEQGVIWGLLDSNPCARVKAPSPTRRDMQILTGPQLAELLTFCRESKYFVPIQIAAATGMRRGEILALHWDQVDFERSTITVLYSLEEVGRQLTLKMPKNNPSRRTIEIDPDTMAILAEHKRAQDEIWETIGAAPKRRLVCIETDGAFMRPKNLSTGFRCIIEKSGLPRIRLHDLRHTHASLLLHAGISIVQVSARLGHVNPYVTMSIYAHNIPHSGRESAAMIGRILAQGAEALNAEAA